MFSIYFIDIIGSQQMVLYNKGFILQFVSKHTYVGLASLLAIIINWR